MKKISIYLILVFAFLFVPAFISTVKNAEAERACTLEAKICPDGSAVGRQGSNCEFAQCPGEKGITNDENENSEEGNRGDSNGGGATSDSKDGDEVESVATSTDDSDDMATTTNNEDEDDAFSKRSEERKSRVAIAVQEMHRVASSTQATIGEQIRVIAQEQNQEHEQIETALQNVSERGGFARFFIGPDYSEIKKAEQSVEKYNEKLQKMGEEVSQLTAQDLIDSLNTQIKAMEEVKTELQSEIEAQKGGFSLFGWLNRLLSK